jgi:hypothetical protein
VNTLKTEKSDLTWAAPCGLYCGACIDNLEHKSCHGCGCECGGCAAIEHHKTCNIYQCCVIQKKLNDCSECPDFPCTQLIQFCYSPVWQHHFPVIENLRRRKAIGTEEWLREQKSFWRKYEWYLRAWLWLQRECEGRLKSFKQDSAIK